MASILDIQKQLNAKGFGPLVEDGKGGPKTKAAVIAFQKASGLQADGVVGPKTIAALFAQVGTKPSPATPKEAAEARVPFMDKVSLDRIETLHPALREEAKKIYQEAAKALTGRSALRFAFTSRSFAEQAVLYNQGRTTPGKIVTNARAGYSFHNYDMAVDIVLLVDHDGNGTYTEASWDNNKDFDDDHIADWMEVVAIFKKYRWKWGGDWVSIKDRPHFEKTFGFSVSQLLAKYQANNFYPGTKYVKL